MKIIRLGNLDLLKEIRQFHCEDCDCDFEANRSEYGVVFQNQKEYYYCKCPTCGFKVFIE